MYGDLQPLAAAEPGGGNGKYGKLDKKKSGRKKSRGRKMKKSNSTSTLKLGCSLYTPDTDRLMLGVGHMMHFQMNRDSERAKKGKEFSKMNLFNEYRFSPFEDDKDGDVASVEEMYNFIKSVFELAQFSPECVVICYIYVNRVTTAGNIQLHAKNWRPIVLISLLLAQKVWDDQSLANVEFPVIWRASVSSSDARLVNIQAVNTYECDFLEVVQYNVHFTPSVYASYFFSLMSLHARHLSYPLLTTPLTHELGLHTGDTPFWVEDREELLQDLGLRPAKAIIS